MTDILQNEQVQAALIALIVVALNALAQWVRSKVSHTKIVDDYWCYIQPVVEVVRQEVVEVLKNNNAETSVLRAILSKGLAAWADSYRANERRDPTATQLAAIASELEEVIETVMNGGK
jgi:predicted component of type VI protein secretion system